MISERGSVPNLGSISGQQHVVSTELVVGGAGMNNKEDKEKERLGLFGNNISVYIY